MLSAAFHFFSRCFSSTPKKKREILRSARNDIKIGTASCQCPRQIAGQLPAFILPFAESGSSRALIHGVTISSAILEFGHSCERPVCPPSGFTQDHLAVPPDCISRYKSAIGTCVSFSPFRTSMGAEGWPRIPCFLRDSRGPYA